MGENKKDPPIFAFVALNLTVFPTEERLTVAVRDSLGAEARLTEFKSDGKVLQCSIAERIVTIGLIEKPIPWGDLEGPAATSWLWKEATTVLKAHKAHLIVTVFGGDGTLIEKCIFLTKILSAVTHAWDSVGIYWGHGTVVLSNELLRKQARNASVQYPPLMAWIEFRLQRESDGTVSVLTTGLDYFSSMEIEVVRSKRRPAEILPFVTEIAAMLLAGEIFRNGDTVGPDAESKIKTEHAKSMWDRKPLVLRIEY